MSQKRLKKLRKQQAETENKIQNSKDSKHELLPKFWDIIKKNWKFLVLMSLLAIALYANAMSGDFVSDDYATIPQNPEIGSFKYAMTHAMFGNSMNLTNFFIYKIFGFASPVPYHVTSLIYYLIFNVLAFVFVKLITKNDWVTKISMLIFVFHPIHVESVSWNAGKIYLILAIYILASVINFIYYLDRGKTLNLILSGLFFILAFQTDRPRPFAVFLIILLYFLFLGWRSIWDKYAKYFWWLIAVAILGIIISWPFINSRINIVNSGYNASESIFYNPFFQYPTEISKYLQLLFIPVDLTLYHTMYVLPGWLNWLILLNYLALIVYFYIKDKKYFFALSFIFVAIAPSIAPIKVSWLVAERYMFLGSLGFCWFLGLLVNDHWKKLKYLTPTLLLSLMVYYGVRTYTRNIDWSTNHNLWVNTCQVSPNSHNAWNNIGDDYDKLKDYDNAVKGFTQSVLVKPNYADAYHNRANIFFKTGRLDLARESYDTALRFTSTLFQTYLSLTQIDLNEGKFDLALAHASKAVEIQPGDPQANFVLGVVLAQGGRVEEAKNIMKQILTIYPDYKMARDALTQLESVKVGNS